MLNTYSTFIGLDYTFGADFYTEMYSVTRNIGSAINKAYVAIMGAFGWLFIIGGIIDICVFGHKWERKKKEFSEPETTEDTRGV